MVIKLKNNGEQWGKEEALNESWLECAWEV